MENWQNLEKRASQIIFSSPIFKMWGRKETKVLFNTLVAFINQVRTKFNLRLRMVSSFARKRGTKLTFDFDKVLSVFFPVSFRCIDESRCRNSLTNMRYLYRHILEKAVFCQPLKSIWIFFSGSLILVVPINSWYLHTHQTPSICLITPESIVCSDSRTNRRILSILT